MLKKLLVILRALPLWLKLVLPVVVIAVIFVTYRHFSSSSSAVTYQTSTAKKGTLITSISVSGTISTGNTTNISTKASGVVQKVYVQNGDIVQKDDTILTLTLDSDGIERRSSAWSDYLHAKEAVTAAIKAKQDLEIEVWQKKQAILDAADTYDYMLNHESDYTDAERNEIKLAVEQAQLAFDVTADEFSHADDTITAAKIAADASFRDYQDVSGTIIAPAAGIINNLTLTAGSTLTASSSQSTSSGTTYASSQNIGFIRSDNNQYLAEVTLTETDVTKVKAGQKVTLEMDAHSDKSFTGEVLAVDVGGSSNSGVTSYPATIAMDSTDLPIYPNMTVSATIITDTQTDVLLIPLSAVTTKDEVSTVQKMIDGEPTVTTIEIGHENDTDVVVISGLSEGDIIVTSSSTNAKNDNTTSAFSSSNQIRSGMGGGGMPMGGPGF